MSIYKDIAEQLIEFYRRYEYPVIEPYIVGFAGIDPPLKSSADYYKNHEVLDRLLGGEKSRHYHLTKQEYEGFKQLIGEGD